MKPWNYLLLLFLPAMVVAGYFLGGWFNFLVPFCCFVVYPVANLFIPSSNTQQHSHNNYSAAAYSSVALFYVPVLVVLTGWAVYIAGNTAMDAVSFTGLVLSVGLVNTVLGFTLAHEFIHRFSKAEQAAGYLLLLLNNYMHYGIEHVWGHHVYACTPEDPHTARIGESLYAYLPRAINATYKNALKIETKKLSRLSYASPFIHNRMLFFALLQIVLILTVFFTCGLQSLAFFLLQNVVAILLLHIINYMQHYGLMRKKNMSGDYEKLGSLHAWNARYERKSINVFQLENHADHHMHPARPYEKLSHLDDSPAHPASYSSMVLLSLVPPLWFRIMNKKIPSIF